MKEDDLRDIPSPLAQLLKDKEDKLLKDDLIMKKKVKYVVPEGVTKPTKDPEIDSIMKEIKNKQYDQSDLDDEAKCGILKYHVFEYRDSEV